MRHTPLVFGTTITTDSETGQVLSVYFQVRSGKVAQTIEFENGAAFADYNSRGELIGIEVLEPCRVSIIDRLAEHEPVVIRRRMKDFMRRNGPREMVAA